MPITALQTRLPELELTQPLRPCCRTVLTPDALDFVAALVAEFTPELRDLLDARDVRQARFDAGAMPGFDPTTRSIRHRDWQVAPIPQEVQDRRTEITGPTSRKMVINALNSSAQVFMADFEDSTSPTWFNVVRGQLNLRDAVHRTIEFTNDNGKHYQLKEDPAVLMVRPRGLHLPERHLRFEGRPIPAALMDFGLFLFHNHAELKRRGSRPYFYLPKLEHGSEAAWWARVIDRAEQMLGIEKGTVRVTVLIETLPAVFQMDEILHALRDRILGLNCGRWDYIFSYIKTFRNHPDRILPDRGQVTMGVPFLRAYSKLLVRTCHRRGAFAMGGMAAQIPIRTDAEANEAALARVREDKRREAGNGHDGTWVAHPALEPLARAEFDAVLEGPNQIDRPDAGDPITTAELLAPCEGTISEAGVRGNVSVAIRYLAAWLGGTGCVPLDHLMEDAATAEIARTQLWQWARHGARMDDGTEITHDHLDEVFEATRCALVANTFNGETQAINTATEMLRHMTRNPDLESFLTLPAYWRLRP